MIRQPFANAADSGPAAMIVDHIGMRHVALHHRPDRILRPDDPHLPAVRDAPLGQLVPFAGQRLVGGIRDLARKPETSWRIAIRARISLHEDAVEYGVFGVINPVLLGKVLPADPDVHATHRNVPQRTGSSPD